MQKRFRGLNFIGLLLKIIGVFEMIIGVASLIMLPLILSEADAAFIQFGFANAAPGIGLIIGVVAGALAFLTGLVCGLLTFSLGELFNVFIAIEENTRASVILLQAQK
ncbi:MAG: Uncharacterized protein FD147_2286 [Chloroflexi bacterium]|nr:MAG: Uncharacterized protein FD147_2286 [Chloroflexota bacterium]